MGQEPGLWFKFPGESSIPLPAAGETTSPPGIPPTDKSMCHTERLWTKKGRVIKNLPSETGREAGFGAQLKLKLGRPLRTG